MSNDVVSFDGEDDSGDRIIKGTILRCVDGQWSCNDESDPPEKLIALSTALALQHWEDGNPVETIVRTPDKPLPDLDTLNAQIPQEQWEAGIDGKPRPPWVRQHVVYLLDPTDGSLFTYINSTVGAAIAVKNLKERVKMMQALRGLGVVPVVTLGTRPMTTKFGRKIRPEFTVEKWVQLGGNGGGTLQLTHGSELKTTTEPTLQEQTGDRVRF